VTEQSEVTGVYLNSFPVELWRKVKAAAALEGATVQQWVIDNLRKLVEKESR
jgi:hypothetical protein